jgi:predicted nucleic acid-binding protein
MHKVIVNSTPLIVLCGIGRLYILKDMYEEIFIPYAVFREVTAKEDSVCVQIRSARSWIRVEEIKDHSEKKMYKAKLHDGEVEVMILAQEQKADLIILDDNAAKKTAKYLGLTVTGTLGVLVKAKRQGIIEEVRPILSEMKQNGFYIGRAVERMVLDQAGE